MVAATKPDLAAEPESAAKPDLAVEPIAATKPESAIKPDSAVEPIAAAEPESAAKPDLAVEPVSATEPINPLLKVGDHVITRRVGYTHHGLYLGAGKVLEYIRSQGVVIVPLTTFTQGHELFIREHKDAKYCGQEAVRRGMMRLGEQHYNLLTRNCEHFVNWCIEGVESSRQIDNLILTIIPFYSLFQQSNFVRGCLRIIYDDPHSLDKALARINWHQASSQNPVTRAQELSEDIFGTKNEGVVHFATLFTTAAQLSQEYSTWLKEQQEQEQRLMRPRPHQPSHALAPRKKKTSGKWQHFKAWLKHLGTKLRYSLSGLPLLFELLPGKRPHKSAPKHLPLAEDKCIPNIHIKLDATEVKATVATAAHSVSYHAPYQRPMTRAEANDLAYHVANQIEQELRAQYELRSESEHPPK